jgi:hypothetical protein
MSEKLEDAQRKKNATKKGKESRDAPPCFIAIRRAWVGCV